MKTFVGLIGTVFLAMVIASTINSVFVWMHLSADMAPVEVGTNVTEPRPSAGDSVKREDMAIPEFRITDNKSRSPSGYSVNISNSTNNTERAEFPSSW